MNKEVLLNSGYEECDIALAMEECDAFYQKIISKKPFKCFNIYYYDKFKDNGLLDYAYEYEYMEERENYWYKSCIWSMDKDYPYTIEEIEDILTGVGNDNKEQNRFIF